jgi:hypothetical protein
VVSNALAAYAEAKYHHDADSTSTIMISREFKFMLRLTRSWHLIELQERLPRQGTFVAP